MKLFIFLAFYYFNSGLALGQVTPVTPSTPPGAPDLQEKKPQDEIHKGLRFNFESRFFLQTDFSKPIKGEFVVTSRPEFTKQFKDQAVVSKYKECSDDPVVPMDPDLYQLSFYGEKAALSQLTNSKNLKLKVQIKLNKEAVTAVPNFKLKSKLMSVFHVAHSEDCGLAATPLKSKYDSKNFEISAVCQAPKCKVSSPVINKASLGELNLMVGYLSDEYQDELEEENAIKAEEASDSKKKTSP